MTAPTWPDGSGVEQDPNRFNLPGDDRTPQEVVDGYESARSPWSDRPQPEDPGGTITGGWTKTNQYPDPAGDYSVPSVDGDGVEKFWPV